jgi:hypothetical protein
MRRCVLCVGRVRTAALHASLRPAHSLRSRSCLCCVVPNSAQTNKQRCAALLPRCCADRCSHSPRAAAAARGRARDARLHGAATNGQTHDIRCAACMHACMQHTSCSVRRAAGSRGRVRDARARQGACGPRVCPSFHTVRPPTLARSAPPPQPLPQPAGASPPPATQHIQRVTSGVEMRALVSRQSRVSRLPTVPAC